MSQQFSQQVVEQKIAVRTQSDLLNLPVENILVEVAIATDRGLDDSEMYAAALLRFHASRERRQARPTW